METKSFIKTSEFWLTLITALTILITSIADLYPGRWAAVATAVLIAGYSVARGVAKAGVPPVVPVTPEEPVVPVQRPAEEK